MLNKIILFPFGGNAKEALCAIEEINAIKPTWEVIGFVDDNPDLIGKQIHGVEVLGGREVLESVEDALVLAVPGSSKNFMKRKSVIESLGLESKRYAQVIHPQAVIASDVQIGVNTLICANVVCGPNSMVGDHCFILPNTTLGHDTKVSTNCCIASNVALAGYVAIEEGCYIGAGANIINDVVIHAGALVGMGANVLSSVESCAVMVGNPAKQIKKVLS